MAGSLSVRQKNAEAARQRRIDALKVERRRANEAATANVGKLGSGIASIPKRVVNYIKSSSPSSVARDVKGIARSTYDAAVEDPNAFAEDAVFSPLAAIRDFGDVRETARKLRAQGRNAEAEKMEAMAGTAVLSAVPILGRPAGVATRKAIKAAEKTAIKGAKKGAFDLRSKGYNTAKVGDTTVEYAVGPSGVEVSKVFTPPEARGQGSARAAMQSLVEAADREGLQLNLTPDPLDAATSKTKLQGFYSSLGFTPNKGRNKDFATRAAMLRTPQQSQDVKGAMKVEPKPRKAKYQPVEPVEKPHPELADVEFPSGSGKGGAFAIERKVPIVGRRPFIAQSPGGYSRLAGGLPANQVTVESKPFVDMPERQFLDPHDLVKEFRAIVPFIGDKLRGGEDIISIAGRPQEGYARAHSGPDFARQQMGAGGREVWASGPSVISALDRMALEGQEKFGGPVAGVYTTMGPEALDQTTAMMEQIGRQIAAGGASPKDVRAFDDAIRTASRKDDEAIPDFVGFANDPMEAIRQLNDVKNVSMGQRRTLTQMMNAKPWLEAGLPDIGANRAGLTIPELLYAPEGTSGYAISALEPGKGALPDEAVSLAHPNYLKKLGGTYLGGFEVGVPRELAWSKLYGHPEMQKYEQFRQLGYLFGRPPKEIRADFGHDPRIQPIDEQWADQIAEYIDAVKKYGEEPYASGGLAVRKKKKSFAAKAK